MNAVEQTAVFRVHYFAARPAAVEIELLVETPQAVPGGLYIADKY
jgi:hypothetical protein